MAGELYRCRHMFGMGATLLCYLPHGTLPEGKVPKSSDMPRVHIYHVFTKITYTCMRGCLQLF